MTTARDNLEPAAPAWTARDRVDARIMLGALGLAAALALFGTTAEALLPVAPRSHVEEWPAFYRRVVRPAFRLPREARVVRAEDSGPSLFRYHMLVQFTLPRRKLAERWVAGIARRNDLDRFRKNPFLYLRASPGGEVRRVEYLPDRDLYQVEVSINQ